ncbi:hypothetical protein [Roseateles sp. P5_E4]
MSRAVLCFEGAKDAALYFDQVLLAGLDERNEGGLYLGNDEIPHGALISIAMNLRWRKKWGFHTYGYEELDQHYVPVVSRSLEFSKALRRANRDLLGYPDFIKPVSIASSYLSNAYIEALGRPQDFLAGYAATLGLPQTSLMLPSQSFGALSGGSDEPIVTFAKLKLIDTDKAAWEQILELRNDENSRRKLQRLRAFLDSTYANKSISFIEDDICRRLDDYDMARKKHGFEVVVGSLSAIVDAKAMQATAAAGICAAFLVDAEVALTATFFVELAQFSLHLARRSKEGSDWSQTHDLAYIFEAKRAIDFDSNT